MKTKTLITLLTLAALCATKTMATAVLGSGFTYQGRLNDGGVPASGTYDFTFVLYDTATNGAIVGTTAYSLATPVTNGLFTVQLGANNEFGGSAFDGSARWLEISARTNDNKLNNNFVALTPRQPLTATPCALFAQNAANVIGNVSASQITGTISSNNFGAGSLTTTMLADGSVTPDKAPGLLAAVAHDGTLNGNGTAGSPLGFKLPLAVSGGFNQAVISVTSTNFSQYALVATASSTAPATQNGGSALLGVGGKAGYSDYSDTEGGAGVVGIGGDLGQGQNNFGESGPGVWGKSTAGDGVRGTGSTGVSGSGFIGVSGEGYYGVQGYGKINGVLAIATDKNGVGVVAMGNPYGTNNIALEINGGIRVKSDGNQFTNTPVFIHKVSAANIEAGTPSRTTISNSFCDGRPDAMLFITHNYSPPGTPGISETNSTGVYYNTGLGRWQIYHENGAAMQLNASYNVFIVIP